MKKLKERILEIRPGFMEYLQRVNPYLSYSTYDTRASDANYLLNNGAEDDFLRFLLDTQDNVKTEIEKIFIIRGREKYDTRDIEYYYSCIGELRNYINSLGGIEALIV